MHTIIALAGFHVLSRPFCENSAITNATRDLIVMLEHILECNLFFFKNLAAF
jgi:hypothetical protein